MLPTKDTSTKKAPSRKTGTASGRTKRGAPKAALVREAIGGAEVLGEERNRMVAEAAYFIAEHRGFIGGSSLEDWLAAEAQVDTMLSRRAT